MDEYDDEDEIDLVALEAKIKALTPAQQRQLAEQQLQARIEAAREDFNEFAELVCVDDETGQPITQAPIHERWAELCDQYDRILIWSHIASGKSTQISILRTVWELGIDPTLRFVILSNTSSIAIKLVKAIAQYIESNAMVKRIFPDLVPDPKGPWTNSELMIVRDGLIRKGKKIRNTAKDPSVRAVGVHGALTSGRVDRLIVDDILDPEIVRTEESRKELESWYKAVAVSRLTKRAKVRIIGTAYHPKDLLHTIARQKGFHWFRFPILDKEGNITWPEQWPPSRVETMRNELGPSEFARSCLCLPRDDDEARFKQEWVDLALARGTGLSLVHNIKDMFPEGLPEGYAVLTGVDLGVKKTRRADETVLFSFLQDPNGNRRVLEILAGKFTGPEIVNLLMDVHKRLRPLVIAVENVAAQDFIIQFSRQISNIPVHPHTTSKAKHDPLLGVEGLAVELGNGKWVIPNEGRDNVDPQIHKWIVEMLFYSPKAHTGDRLMACYFAREAARTFVGAASGGPSVGVRVIGGEGARVQDKRPFNERVNDVVELTEEEEANARERARNARHASGE